MYTANKKGVVMKSDVALPLKWRYGLEKCLPKSRFLTCLVLVGYSFELKVISLPEILKN